MLFRGPDWNNIPALTGRPWPPTALNGLGWTPPTCTTQGDSLGPGDFASNSMRRSPTGTPPHAASPARLAARASTFGQLSGSSEAKDNVVLASRAHSSDTCTPVGRMTGFGFKGDASGEKTVAPRRLPPEGPMDENMCPNVAADACILKASDMVEASTPKAVAPLPPQATQAAPAPAVPAKGVQPCAQALKPVAQPVQFVQMVPAPRPGLPKRQSFQAPATQVAPMQGLPARQSFQVVYMNHPGVPQAQATSFRIS